MSRDKHLSDFKGADGRLVHSKVSEGGTLFTQTGGGGWTKVAGPKPKDAGHAGDLARSKHGEKK